MYSYRIERDLLRLFSHLSIFQTPSHTISSMHQDIRDPSDLDEGLRWWIRLLGLGPKSGALQLAMVRAQHSPPDHMMTITTSLVQRPRID